MTISTTCSQCGEEMILERPDADSARLRCSACGYTESNDLLLVVLMDQLQRARRQIIRDARHHPGPKVQA